MYPSSNAFRRDFNSINIIKRQGEQLTPEMLVVGNIYGIPSGLFGPKGEIYQVSYEGMANLGTSDEKYIFKRILTNTTLMPTAKQLRYVEIEIVEDRMSLNSQTSAKLLDNGNVKFDKDPLPDGFLKEGEEYSITSYLHADDKNTTSFRAKKYIYLGRNNQEGSKIQGGYIFGLKHALNKTIIFPVRDITDIRIERLVDPDPSSNVPLRLITSVKSVNADEPASKTAQIAATSDIPATHNISENEEVSNMTQQTLSQEQPSDLKLSYFMPNKYNIDMEAPLSKSSKLYERAKPFLQEDKADATYALFDDLMGKITNREALLLIVVSQHGEYRKSNITRTLKKPNMSEVNEMAEGLFVDIFTKLDISETSPHYAILKYGLEFFGFDPEKIMASAKMSAPKEQEIETQELVTDTKVLADELFATMNYESLLSLRKNRPISETDKAAYTGYHHTYRALVNMAAKVLDPKEFSMLAFYMRPVLMRPPQDKSRWVDLPKSISAYRTADNTTEVLDASYLAAIKVKTSEDYKANSRLNSRQNAMYLACQTLKAIIENLSTVATANAFSKGSEIEKAAMKRVKSDKKDEAQIDVPSDNPQTPVALTEVESVMQDVIATLPKKDGEIVNKGYSEALKIAAKVLSVEEFSVLAFYLRPTKMYVKRRGEGQVDTRVDVPASTLPYQEGKSRVEIYKICAESLAKIIGSDVFKAIGTTDRKTDAGKAASVIQSLAGYMDKKNIAPTQEEAKPVVAEPIAPKRASKTSVKPKTQEVSPATNANPPVVESANTSTFNNVSGVLNEEAKHLNIYSPPGGLLRYFAEVAGLGPRSLALLSMTMLRNQKLKPEEAAQKVGLDFEDASAMVESAIAKIKAKASADQLDFILTPLNNYSFERK